MKMTFFSPEGRTTGVVHVRGPGYDQVSVNPSKIGTPGVVAKLGNLAEGVACRVARVLRPTDLYAATVQTGDLQCEPLRQGAELSEAALFAAFAGTGLSLTQVAACFAAGGASFVACVGVGLAAAAAIYIAYQQNELNWTAYYDCLLNPPDSGGGNDDGGGEGQPTDDWSCEDEWWCFSLDGGSSWNCGWIRVCRLG